MSSRSQLVAVAAMWIRAASLRIRIAIIFGLNCSKRINHNNYSALAFFILPRRATVLIVPRQARDFISLAREILASYRDGATDPGLFVAIRTCHMSDAVQLMEPLRCGTRGGSLQATFAARASAADGGGKPLSRGLLAASRATRSRGRQSREISRASEYHRCRFEYRHCGRGYETAGPWCRCRR